MGEIRTYQIADVTLGLLLPEGCSVLGEECFLEFRRESCRPDVLLEYSFLKTLPPYRGVCIYADKRTRVYQDKERRFRYTGCFIEETGLSMCQYCQEYREGENRRFHICLKGRGDSVTERELFNAMGLEQLMLHCRKVILHSSFISYRGRGIVFSAPSGTGKSTQAELWRRNVRGVEIINGDRSILGCENGRPWVYGLPLCGSSGITRNRSCPLYAVIVLRQGKENRLRPLKGAEAMRLLLSECGVSPWEKGNMEHALDVLSGVLGSVQVYQYSCLPDRTAVEMLKHALEGGEKNGPY